MSINKDTPNHRIIKTLERKILVVLLALFFIMAMPHLSDQYLAFNMIYNTQLMDIFSILKGTRIAEFSILYFLVATILLYIVHISVRLFIVKRNESDSERLFDVYRQFDVVTFLVILITVYIFINAFLFSISSVVGKSMQPTLYQNDHVIIRHVYGDYNRFDMVVIQRTDQEEYMVKRLIGLPGETVTIDDGAVYVDGTLLDESAYLEPNAKTVCEFGDTYCSFTLEDRYFFLGDNRNPKQSSDSRHFGPVERNNLYGTVNFRIRPFNAFGRID